MEYDNEDKEDKRYKKQYSKKEFKQDVADAIDESKVRKAKGKKKLKPKPTGKYDTWSVSQLRSKLNEKKKNLLTKAGFPEGKLPRSKNDMAALCKKLKRKRW
jgi:hypothetical protein